MRIESWVGVTAVLLLMFGGAIAAEPQQCRRSPIPSNVELAHDLEQVLERIYDRSPAFRAQCERIASAGNLRVTVRIDTSIPSRCRAFTIIQRRGKNIRADVHLPPSSGLIRAGCARIRASPRADRGARPQKARARERLRRARERGAGVRDRSCAGGRARGRGRSEPPAQGAGCGLTSDL